MSLTTNVDDVHSVVLTIDGWPTELVMQSGVGNDPVATFGRAYNFPNPMRDNTRFVFESSGGRGWGVIRIFSVAGSVVAQIKFDQSGTGSDIVTWDGRDSRGDELGNGTYLYRIEIEAPGGRIVSEMQRLVMMR
jgi:phosphatidylserine decarboxylase